MTERAPGPRARARAQTIDDIKRVARLHLATAGADLSLRSVARELGMVSSAVYRYFESRDALLTAIIIDAYDEMGEAVERAESGVRRSDLRGRWQAAGHAVRDWSRGHPAEYGLLYGTPVPGYSAPEDTIGPASRPVVVMTAILRDGLERGILVPAPHERLPATTRADLEGITEVPGFDGVTPAILARGMGVWAALFGLVSFELFGRLTNAVHDYDAWFDYQLRLLTRELGL
ncbi:TetR/AcrR family transcriptional regulator [Nocardioides cynanchi]|uniref:TetR/AcrR family transcriptional regulator n=1 Tax=Nocardioides cynanchi TaxID=2558918 RepID=UPI001248B33E|nr:TetR/AcrR family transcriptional regulator [Nocardioides cynanchi]